MRLWSALVLSFFVCVLVCNEAHANEGALGVFRSEMETLKQMVQGLQSQVGELTSTVKSQNEVIQKQSLKIAALERVKESTPQQATAQPIPVGAPRTAGIMGFNPEIGLVGDVEAKLTQNKADEKGNNTIALKELELNLAQVVDPFSRLDAVISFNDSLENQNVSIEEGYYTRWGLPLGFLGQIGKFRSKVGKQNLLHLDQLDTVDYPLVVKDFFGEEGLASSGARLQNMIPNPWDIPIEITGEILRGNNGNSFSGISRRPIFNSHVKTYFDVSQDANVELGWTTLFGDENPPITIINSMGSAVSYTRPEGQDRYGVKVFGGDMTFNWFLPEGRKLKWQNEIYFQDRTSRTHANSRPWGFYSLLDFRLSQRFSAGVRFDYLEPLNVRGQDHHTIGISPYLVFWQSEFADFRLQYSRLDFASDREKSDNALFLKANFLIGAHKHPVQ